ncbi:MAG: hypothetical protein NTY69_02640 [Methylococcales bacterium]|nr:hypothetical protein [Methylococcales bacterium]
MNIWALKKDIPLRALLLELQQRYSEINWELNSQEQNAQAIELFLPEAPTLSAYVYTFGQNPNSYGIDLRYPIPAHNSVGENENLNLDRAIEIIAIHLFY